MSWHEISRISIKNDEVNDSLNATSLLRDHSMLKVSDIGFSFDMMLDE
jgi:hypothetical protein